MVRIKTQDLKLYQRLYYINNRDKILDYSRQRRENKNKQKHKKPKEKFKILEKQIIIKFD